MDIWRRGSYPQSLAWSMQRFPRNLNLRTTDGRSTETNASTRTVALLAKSSRAKKTLTIYHRVDYYIYANGHTCIPHYLCAHLGSTLAVASSRMRILFFLRRARARHNSCLCPTLKFVPPWDTGDSSCKGSSAITGLR